MYEHFEIVSQVSILYCYWDFNSQLFCMFDPELLLFPCTIYYDPSWKFKRDMMNEHSIFWLNLAALEDNGKQHTSDPYNSIWFWLVGII